MIIRAMIILMLIGSDFSSAEVSSSVAKRYRSELIRVAHSVWGLDAPVPVFAAQIHQESGWNPQAVSRVGAKGMAQFMPATTRWWCDINRLSAENCQPTNPTWAMRALVGYDKYLYEKIPVGSEFDRLWAALRSYNGGLGHWRAEAKHASDATRSAIDAACGRASRHRLHCAENLSYPQKIMLNLQPRYAAWGRTIAEEKND